MPEWSKGADLSSAIERCVGSNPTGCIFSKKKVIKEKRKIKKGKKEKAGTSCNEKSSNKEAFVPEWSKGSVSRTDIERCVGSNPTGCIFAKNKK